MPKSVVVLCFLCFVGAAAGQIHLPNGFEFLNLTNDVDEEEWFRMNNCGEIVFSKKTDRTYESYEVFFFDNGSTTRLTFNDVPDRVPQINSLGAVVWQHEEFYPSGYYIYRFKDGVIESLGPGFDPLINDLGHLSWEIFNGQGCEQAAADVYFHDGEKLIQVTFNEYSNQVASLNNLDELVWTRYDFCPTEWESDIMHWANGVTTQITFGENGPQLPEINDGGTMTWVSDDEFYQEFIKVLENGQEYVLTEVGNGPNINNLGDIAYSVNFDGPEGGAWLYVKSEDAFYQLSDNDPITGAQDINDWGEVAIYMNYGWPHTDVGLMRRIRTGDSEFDGDVDSDDQRQFESCYTGPGRVDRLCDCRFLDIDHDGDVDCDDWALFTTNWTEEGGSPFFETCDGPVSCAGDANSDGEVDPLDSGFVLARLGCDLGGPDPSCVKADVNVDSVVDPLDVGFVLSRFGMCP